jgi:hypothetical protein
MDDIARRHMKDREEVRREEKWGGIEELKGVEGRCRAGCGMIRGKEEGKGRSLRS